MYTNAELNVIIAIKTLFLFNYKVTSVVTFFTRQETIVILAHILSQAFEVSSWHFLKLKNQTIYFST